MAPPKIDFESKIGLVSLNSSQIYDEIAKALEIGSGREKLSWEGFTFKQNHDSNVTEASSFDEMVEAGVPYLDALVLSCSGNIPEGIVIEKRDVSEKVRVDYIAIASGLFAWYFSLFSQGKAIASGANNFLVDVLGLGTDWQTLVRSLTSSRIELFPKKWIKSVKLDSLDEASRNRLAMGAAGQRFLQAITYIRDSDYAADQEDSKAYIDGLKLWTKGLTHWDLHPVFKSGQIITITKSLNKSIEDCLHVALNEVGKNRLVRAKILFESPKEQPAHAQWRSFDIRTLPQLREPIF